VKFFAALILTLFATACSNGSRAPAAPAAAAPPVDPATVGTLTGQVVLTGTAPTMQLIRIDGDPKCVALNEGQERRAENVLLGDNNSLQNAFVYIKEGLPPGMYPVPADPVVLDQQKCRYVPHVLGLQVGQSLAIRNSDPLLHNVRSDGVVNQPFDVGTPLQGIEIKKTFATREVMVPFKCNVHGWMTAYVGVLEHPFFAVTDANGRFSIPKLPPGTYTIEVWHETLGTQTQQVTVAAKETKDLSFSYKAS
jgi:Carboxypeptidase regulatory-like domain